jgi:hypothetical protein
VSKEREKIPEKSRVRVSEMPKTLRAVAVKIRTSHPADIVSVFRSGEDSIQSTPSTAIGVANGYSRVKVEVLSSRLCEPVVPRSGEVMPPMSGRRRRVLRKRGRR